MRVGISVMAACLSITGCSMVGLDAQKSFTCKAPPGINCSSLSGVYANAVADNLPGSAAKPFSRYSKENQAKVAEMVVGEAPQTGTPVLSAPSVLRVWVAPWEDSRKVLHDQAFLYAVADPGHWQVAHSTQKIANQYRVMAPTAKPQPALSQPAVPQSVLPQSQFGQEQSQGSN